MEFLPSWRLGHGDSQWSFSLPGDALFLRFSFFSPQHYWGVIDKQNCVYLEHSVWWFGTCIYCKMITTIKLINTSTTSNSYSVCVSVCVCVVGTLKFWSLSKFQVYNTALLLLKLFFGHVTHRVLVPWSGIEPMPPALKVWSLNQRTTREVPQYSVINYILYTMSPKVILNLKICTLWSISTIFP